MSRFGADTVGGQAQSCRDSQERLFPLGERGDPVRLRHTPASSAGCRDRGELTAPTGRPHVHGAKGPAVGHQVGCGAVAVMSEQRVREGRGRSEILHDQDLGVRAEQSRRDGQVHVVQELKRGDLGGKPAQRVRGIRVPASLQHDRPPVRQLQP